MSGKLMFLGGVAIGFVLGTRAGRERYDQLVSAARQLRDHPTVQEAAGVVQAQANRLYSEGKDVVSERLSHSKLGERFVHQDQVDPLDAAEHDPFSGTGGKRPPSNTF